MAAASRVTSELLRKKPSSFGAGVIKNELEVSKTRRLQHHDAQPAAEHLRQLPASSVGRCHLEREHGQAGGKDAVAAPPAGGKVHTGWASGHFPEQPKQPACQLRLRGSADLQGEIRGRALPVDSGWLWIGD